MWRRDIGVPEQLREPIMSESGQIALVSSTGRDATQAAQPPRARAEATRRLEVAWATDEADVRAAQRLRHRVFACEMGATLRPPAGTPPGHDADAWDPYCDHVLVRAVDADGGSEVVGTYRVLTPDGACRAGGGYVDQEFDLQRLASLRPRMLELGRSCIEPSWRTGGAMLMLWGAIGEFMQQRGLDIVFGAASISVTDGGRAAAAVWHRLATSRLAPPARRVMPWIALPMATTCTDDAMADAVEMPALIKGYARCGAELLGPPAWDRDFDCADLPMLMPLAGLPQRHRRRFLGGAPEGARSAASDAGDDRHLDD